MLKSARFLKHQFLESRDCRMSFLGKEMEPCDWEGAPGGCGAVAAADGEMCCPWGTPRFAKGHGPEQLPQGCDVPLCPHQILAVEL